jgi:hypothetical protein
MISTKNIPENTPCYIWIGYSDSEDFEEIGGIKLEATFKNGVFIVADDESYLRSVYKYEVKSWT